MHPVISTSICPIGYNLKKWKLLNGNTKQVPRLPPLLIYSVGIRALMLDLTIKRGVAPRAIALTVPLTHT